METFTVTKYIEVDYGHRVPDHKSHCRNVHGHRAKVAVTVEGPLVKGDGRSDNGMVLDFADIKRALETEIKDLFDHAFIMYRGDMELWDLMRPKSPRPDLFNSVATCVVRGFGNVVLLDCIPTAENLAKVCFRRLSEVLNRPEADIKVLQVEFWETPNSVATYSSYATEI